MRFTSIQPFATPEWHPEPVRRRVRASAFESSSACGGESSHVRRDLRIGSSRTGRHGVRSSNYPYRGSFRTWWLDAEGGEGAFGCRSDAGRRSLDKVHRVLARPGVGEHVAALALGHRTRGLHRRRLRPVGPQRPHPRAGGVALPPHD